ncbi:MAG: type I restriction enzyme HsdR N-terminal domain-containing protein [Bacteroidetes bacterium]|nr:type I restriction enzyme HsdR N-terminal domain-containing protein [Bacteroidota bacterium]
MIQLTFSKNNIRIEHTENGQKIFDAVRKKWLALTPEEWVRQNVIGYLDLIKHYPTSLIAIEKEIKLGSLSKRCDIIIYRRNALPWMIIECKEMKAPLSEKTLAQALRYHAALEVPYLIITNGMYCRGFKKENNQFVEIDYFPDYEG